MNTLLDNLFPLIGGTALLAILCFAGWLKTGQRPLAVASGVLLALAIVLVVVERVTLTDQERVQQTIQQIARDVESGDLERMLAHVHPEAPDIRARAAQEMPQYRIASIRIKHGMQIKLDPRHDPPEAVAEFNVVVTGSDSAGFLGESQVPRFVWLRLWKDGDAWKVRDYRHADPLEGMRNR